MAESLRTFRQKIRTVRSTKKITKAMELIAASRIAKAQAQVHAATPYSKAITDVISALASQSGVEHPLTTANPEARRAAVLVVTSDRGLAGAYSANAIRAAERLVNDLRVEGKEAVLFAIGRKALGFYKFRGREVAQSAIASRVLPMELPESAAAEEEPGKVGGLYEFEPGAVEVLDALLPRYVESRVYAALLASAASESASRRRAMQSASDNADDLIKTYTRQANQARQAMITQEISEIVGGADALANA
jgi:F-type H+-transporting ATPase subunit gamma